jgi:hypothetical protein
VDQPGFRGGGRRIRDHRTDRGLLTRRFTHTEWDRTAFRGRIRVPSPARCSRRGI